MKIDSTIATYELSKQLSSSSAGVSDDKQAPGELKPEKNATQDSIVHLSQASKDVQLAEKIIAETADIRAEKVAEIRAKIESDTYEIDHGQVAAKMIDSHLDELL
jgi:negative regulator of flagellin synthesis FlgM